MIGSRQISPKAPILDKVERFIDILPSDCVSYEDLYKEYSYYARIKLPIDPSRAVRINKYWCITLETMAGNAMQDGGSAGITLGHDGDEELINIFSLFFPKGWAVNTSFPSGLNFFIKFSAYSSLNQMRHFIRISYQYED